MPIQPQPNEGSVLSASFDRSAPGFKAEIEEFSKTLAALQKKLAFEAFVPLIKEEGNNITVHVIPAKPGESPKAVASAQDLGRSLSALGKDTFTGTGPLKLPQDDPLADFKKLL